MATVASALATIVTAATIVIVVIPEVATIVVALQLMMALPLTGTLHGN